MAASTATTTATAMNTAAVAAGVRSSGPAVVLFPIMLLVLAVFAVPTFAVPTMPPFSAAASAAKMPGNSVVALAFWLFSLLSAAPAREVVAYLASIVTPDRVVAASTVVAATVVTVLVLVGTPRAASSPPNRRIYPPGLSLWLLPVSVRLWQPKMRVWLKFVYL